MPVPLSFGVFDSYVSFLPSSVLPTILTPLLLRRTHVLADPTSFEEPLLDGTISIILSNANPDRLISVSQLGAGHDALLPCLEAAKVRCREIVGSDIYK